MAPAPKELVSPASAYPPSLVCMIALILSLPAPPYVFCHWVFPAESVFISQKSSKPASKESVSPAMAYPPSLVWISEYAESEPASPKVFCQPAK